MEATASMAIPPNSYCHLYGLVLKEVLAMLMNVCWCSLGVRSMGDDMVVVGSFNVLVVSMCVCDCIYYVISMGDEVFWVHSLYIESFFVKR